MSEARSPWPGKSWRVLLVGGPSGAGKTAVAEQLGNQLRVNVTQLDDIQAALEAVTTPQQLPLLHFWRTHWDEFSAFTDAQHVDHFQEVSRQIFTPVLESLVRDRLDGGARTIIEGDFILPELAAELAQSEGSAGGAVQALFLREDETQLSANFLDRHGGDATLPARTSWLKSQWLQHECERLDVPMIDARPWLTAAARATEALSARWPTDRGAET